MREAPAAGHPGAEAFRFGSFELRLPSRELLRDGQPVELQPKVFDFIAFLLLNRGRAVDKAELLDAVWPRQVVTEAALTRCAMKARRALDDDADNPRVILTVHGRGYRFAADVAPVAERRAVPRGTPLAPDAADADAPAPGHAGPPRRRWQWPALLVLALAGIGLALLLVWREQQQAPRALAAEGPVRLAILPVENATGDERYDWVRLGLMGAIGDILRNGHSLFVLGGREATALEQAADDAGALQWARLRDGYGITHLARGRLEEHFGQLRLHYTVSGPDGTERARTVVASDVPGLAHAAGADLGVLLGATQRQPEAGRISEDPFANEAYLRGRAARLQGDVRGAMKYFQLAASQAPGAFWPRYEIALGQRDLGEHEEAASQLLALMAEADGGGDLAQRMGARNALAILRWREGDNAQAGTLLEEALDLAVRLGSQDRIATVLTNLGILATYRDDYAAARGYLHRAIEAEAAAGMEKTSGNILNSLAQVDLREGDLRSAATHLDGALAFFRLVGERRNEAIALNSLGTLRRREGRFAEARDLARHALEIHRELGNRTSEASALLGLASAEALLGRLQEASGHARAALELAEAIGEKPNAATARSLLGRIELDLGDHAAAREWLQAALQEMQAVDDAAGVRTQRLWLARLTLAEGDAAAAARQARDLLADSTAAGSAPLRVDALRLLADADLAMDDAAAAERRLREALSLAAPLHDPHRTAVLRAALAEALLARGGIDEAEALLTEAQAHLQDTPDLPRVRALLAARRGDAAAALAFEEAAKSLAGERWQPDDERRLQARRAAARP